MIINFIENVVTSYTFAKRTLTKSTQYEWSEEEIDILAKKLKNLTSKVVRAIEKSSESIVHTLSWRFLLENDADSTLWFVGSDKWTVWDKVPIIQSYTSYIDENASFPTSAYSNFDHNKTFYSSVDKRKPPTLLKKKNPKSVFNGKT